MANNIAYRNQYPDVNTTPLWTTYKLHSNGVRTVLQHAMMHTRGLIARPWELDLELGASQLDDSVAVVMKSGSNYSGKLYFDKPRHRIEMGFTKDWPRMNTMPEWFTVEPDKFYQISMNNGQSVGMSGADLINNGLPITLAAGESIEMIVSPENLTLTVDTFDGTMSISNPSTGHDFDINAYSITTTSSTLLGDDANWLSLHDQAVLYPGWTEDASEPNRLAESNPSGSLLFTTGTSVELGRPLQITTPFAQDAVKDVTFEYKPVDGDAVQGAVEYINSRHNNLVLIIDPDTGEGLIQNQSAHDVDIDGYAITTDKAQMLGDVWNSLADQMIAGWQEANPDPNQLAELEPVSLSHIESGETLDLGTIWDVSGDDSLKYQFHLAGGETMEGIIEYISEPANLLKANFNEDEFVDVLDLQILAENWLNNVGSKKQGDANGDGFVSLEDYIYLAKYWLRRQ